MNAVDRSMSIKDAKRVTKALRVLVPQWHYDLWRLDGGDYGIRVSAPDSFEHYAILRAHGDVFRFLAQFGPTP